jgi:hypothetical protein
LNTLYKMTPAMIIGKSSGRSPDGMQWNPGRSWARLYSPDSAPLHPGYVMPGKVYETFFGFV